MTARVMERNWTNIGSEYNSTPEQRKKLSAIFEVLEWETVTPDGLTWPMMPALALEEAIKELRLPKVSAVAQSNAMAPYGLIAARCKYTNGMAEVYIVDEGSTLKVLASDFYPDESALAA